MSTARDIITRSLRLIGVLGADEPGESADLVDSLAALNALLEAWPLSPLMVLAGQTQVFPLTAAYSYGIGPGLDFDMPRIAGLVDGSFIRYNGYDLPVVPIRMAEYAAISSKYQPGQPAYIYYEPTADGGTLNFYPVPSTGMELHLALNAPFTQFADLDTDYALPPGYLRCLQYNLAVEMAPEYNKEPSPVVTRIAVTSVKQIKRANTQVPILGMPNGIPMNGWASYASLMAGSY